MTADRERVPGGKSAPVVSVVTPVYNTARFLAGCIESVLGQTLSDFEYVIADNSSTDGSREIAERYARRDPRIRLAVFDDHLPQLPNYNRALRLCDPSARYCKVAQADDVLSPRCLEEMVRLADVDESIGMVSAYTVLQNRIFLDGLDFEESVLDGREVGRRYLLDGPYVLGSPTTCMYSMAAVLEQAEFYPPDTRIGDADAALRILTKHRFGFVHQILSFVRGREGSISGGPGDFGIDVLTRRVLLEKYGRHFLDPETLLRARKRLARRHHRILGEGFLLRRPQGFWDLHRRELARVNVSVSSVKVGLGALVMLGRMLLNIEGVLRGSLPWHK
jgi:glycosyltransferase involved in cell wall biosynthesis